jgi:hypothetical protein
VNIAATTVFQNRSVADEPEISVRPTLNDLAQLPSLVYPCTTVGFGKAIELRQQQRHLPLVEDGIPIGTQGPQHREVHWPQLHEVLLAELRAAGRLDMDDAARERRFVRSGRCPVSVGMSQVADLDKGERERL